MTFYEFVTADNKNAIETPFFTISSPQKAMIGICVLLISKERLQKKTADLVTLSKIALPPPPLHEIVT